MSLIRLLIFFVLAVLVSPVLAQEPVKWTARVEPADLRVGESGQIIFTATIDKGWHIYGVGKNGGDTRTTLEISPNSGFSVVGDAIEPPTGYLNDPMMGKLAVHSGGTSLALPVRLMKPGGGKLVAKVTFQPCDDRSCLLQTTTELPIDFTPTPGEARPGQVDPKLTVPEQPADHVAHEPEEKEGSASTNVPPKDEFTERVTQAKDAGLGAYLWLAFTMGLLALLTPCVFPMIPITVSFFSKKVGDGEKRQTDYAGATAYSLGIIGTFTGLGVLISVFFGASGVQDLATNPWVNLAMALLFIVLAASLFGAFEIGLPSWLVNKANTSATKKSGFVAPLLMGLTFTLTSFTCTVPFVGTLLAGAAQGNYLYPVLGMAAFSTAFALPFFLLALFPQYLAKLPKSGSWLSTVKATMGFLELAAALKFLSNVDLVWQFGWLTRPIFLALWAGLAFVCALYLFGWIVLGHDPSKPRVGWFRRGFASLSVVAGIYCLAAIEGASLGTLASFLPPDPYPGRQSSVNAAIKWEHTYEAALAKAKAEGRNIFINFTGVTCTNCRNMEFNVFPIPNVASAINEYIPLELYTDRKTPEDQKNQALRESLTGVPSNPVYVILSPDEKVVRVLQGAEPDPEKFLAFLKGSGKVASR